MPRPREVDVNHEEVGNFIVECAKTGDSLTRAKEKACEKFGIGRRWIEVNLKQWLDKARKEGWGYRYKAPREAIKSRRKATGPYSVDFETVTLKAITFEPGTKNILEFLRKEKIKPQSLYPLL